MRRNGLRRALRILAFLPILAAAVLAALDLAILYTAADVTIDYLFGAMLYGIPALFALGGAAAGWLIGRAVKKKRQSFVGTTVLEKRGEFTMSKFAAFFLAVYLFFAGLFYGNAPVQVEILESPFDNGPVTVQVPHHAGGVFEENGQTVT